jgi:hypothetical protein
VTCQLVGIGRSTKNYRQGQGTTTMKKDYQTTIDSAAIPVPDDVRV